MVEAPKTVEAECRGVPFVTHPSACTLVRDRDDPPTLPLLLPPPTVSSLRGPAAESGGVTMGASIPRGPMSVAAVPRELRGGSCPSRFAAGPLLALTRARGGEYGCGVWCGVCVGRMRTRGDRQGKGMH